ncbi:methyltransferase domain-containing protein [Limnobacter sp.]|uniref:methyltransferase domain-containing protein n=1 Tax=Limnobacter sp. TaxID=2003368 RepID=UPI00351472F3
MQNTQTHGAASQRFSGAAADYDHHARVQRHAAQHLCNWLGQVLPAGFQPKACIDVGSGTGFITEHLLNNFKNVPVHAIDLAPGMLEELKRKFPHPRLHTHVLNGEELAFEHLWAPNQSLLMSGMCAQWFSNLEEAIRRWLSVSNTLAFSVLLDGSFQAWQTAHQDTEQTCGLRPLPKATHMLDLLDRLTREGLVAGTAHHSKEFLDHHPDGLSFARSLRAIGADLPRPNHRPVNLWRVIDALGEACTMNYHIGFYYLERP